MKLLITLVSYNRLDYTKQTLASLLETITVPHFIVAVDNASDDGTQDWLLEQKAECNIDEVILNPENYYPGKAVNQGWELGLKFYPQATHLMRTDNDCEFVKGWDIKSNEYFKAIPDLGQLGLDHSAIEDDDPLTQARIAETEFTSDGYTIVQHPGNVGGLCIIPKAIWDKGARYNEGAWHNQLDPKVQEDTKFSLLIKKLGYLVGHSKDDLARTFATPDKWHEYPEYYQRTMRERDYQNDFKFLFEDGFGK